MLKKSLIKKNESYLTGTTVMRISVQVKPQARQTQVQKIDEGHYIVSVREPPIQGRANQAVLQALADYLNLPLAKISLVSGFSSRRKVIEIGS